MSKQIMGYFLFFFLSFSYKSTITKMNDSLFFIGVKHCYSTFNCLLVWTIMLFCCCFTLSLSLFHYQSLTLKYGRHHQLRLYWRSVDITSWSFICFSNDIGMIYTWFEPNGTERERESRRCLLLCCWQSSWLVLWCLEWSEPACPWQKGREDWHWALRVLPLASMLKTLFSLHVYFSMRKEVEMVTDGCKECTTLVCMEYFKVYYTAKKMLNLGTWHLFHLPFSIFYYQKRVKISFS